MYIRENERTFIHSAHSIGLHHSSAILHITSVCTTKKSSVHKTTTCFFLSLAFLENYIPCSFILELNVSTVEWDFRSWIYDVWNLAVGRAKRLIFHWFPFGFAAAGTCCNEPWIDSQVNANMDKWNILGKTTRKKSILYNNNHQQTRNCDNKARKRVRKCIRHTWCSFAVFNKCVQAAGWRNTMWKSWWAFHTIT